MKSVKPRGFNSACMSDSNQTRLRVAKVKVCSHFQATVWSSNSHLFHQCTWIGSAIYPTLYHRLSDHSHSTKLSACSSSKVWFQRLTSWNINAPYATWVAPHYDTQHLECWHENEGLGRIIDAWFRPPLDKFICRIPDSIPLTLWASSHQVRRRYDLTGNNTRKHISTSLLCVSTCS